MSAHHEEDIPKTEGHVEPAPETARFRRLVTGLDENGQSLVVTDEESPHRQVTAGTPTFVHTEFWREENLPAANAGAPVDTITTPITITPPSHGAVFRVLEFPPDSHWDHNEGFAERMMHTTASIDFAIVHSGEIYAVLDEEERLMKAGDVLVQRGTRHAWSNRSDKPALVYFVLIGGEIAS